MDNKVSVVLGRQAPAVPVTLNSLIFSASLPLALHVGSSSVSIQHGIVGGFLDCFAV